MSNGHGHVTPNADGSLARCGGPGLCKSCAVELARLNAQIALDKTEVYLDVGKGKDRTGVSGCHPGMDFSCTYPDCLNPSGNCRAPWNARGSRDT